MGTVHILTMHCEAIPRFLQLCITYRDQNRRGGRFDVLWAEGVQGLRVAKLSFQESENYENCHWDMGLITLPTELFSSASPRVAGGAEAEPFRVSVLDVPGHSLFILSPFAH